jgi:hypothetical protein
MISLLEKRGFGSGQDGNALLGQGWSAPEDGFVWSVGPQSVIEIGFAPAKGRHVLELGLEPFLQPGIVPHQDVSLSVNGRLIDQRRLGGDWVWQVTLPPDIGRGAALRIALHRQPGKIRPDGETRDLGVKLKTLVLLRDTSPPPSAPRLPTRTVPFGWCEAQGLDLVSGFGAPEGGYVWAIGPESALAVPLDGTGQPVLILLDMRPFDTPLTGMRQRIVIGAGDKLIGFFELRTHLVLALRVEPARGQTQIVLSIRNLDAAHDVNGDPVYHYGMPFAWALHSVRVIAAPPSQAPGMMPPLAGIRADGAIDRAVANLTGLTLAELIVNFESLGNCCELGILQIALVGRELPTLLRTSGIPQRELVEGLARDFDLLGRPDTMEFFFRPEPDPTWRLTSGVYGLSNPTPYPRSDKLPENAIHLASRAMARLAEKFLMDQDDGGKIYILRLPVVASIEEAMLAVLAMLRRRSGAPILWLVADRSSEPGTVARLSNGLLRGQLGPEAAGRGMDQDVLIGLLANAWMLCQSA